MVFCLGMLLKNLEYSMKPKNLDPLVKLGATLNNRTHVTYRADYSGALYPNGTFTIGVLPPKPPEGVEALWGPDDVEDALDAALDAQNGPDPLTLSNVPNSEMSQPRGKYGLKGLTTKGRRMLENSCYLLEARLGKGDVGFLTLTVPTLNREARKTLAVNWGKVVNELVKFLSRKLHSQGRPQAIVGCVEIQTARLAKYREGYLHLHVAIPLHSNQGRTYALDISEVRTWWHGCLERHSDTTIPSLPRVQIEPVKKSVEAYMGKYLSKGCQADLDAYIDDLGEESVPGQWWFASKLMKDRVEDATFRGQNVGHLLNCFVQYCFEIGNLDSFLYVQPIEVKIGEVWRTFGWVGKLTPHEAKEMRDFLTP